MKSELCIGIDVDDVLAGFYPAMCKRYGLPERQVDIWDGEVECKFIVEKFHEIRDDFEFWSTLPVISSPESIIFDFDYYVSSFPESMFEARVKWLKDNGFPDKPLLCSKDKLTTCKEYGINVLIDDKKSTIHDIMCGGDILGIRFRPSYMIEDGQDISHLSQVPSVLEKYA